MENNQNKNENKATNTKKQSEYSKMAGKYKRVNEKKIYIPQTEPNPQIPDPPVPNRAHTGI